MFTLQVIVFMTLFTVVLVHMYEWFHTRVCYASSTSLFKVEIFLHTRSCHKYSTSDNGRLLILSLLLDGDVSLNPGPLMMRVLNTRSVPNKGPLLADIVTSHDLDFVCLTETHVHLLDTDSYLRSVTPSDFVFLQRHHFSVTSGGVFSLVKCSIDFPHQVAHIPNKVQSRRYHRINKSNLCSDFQNTSFQLML